MEMFKFRQAVWSLLRFSNRASAYVERHDQLRFALCGSVRQRNKNVRRYDSCRTICSRSNAFAQSL